MHVLDRICNNSVKNCAKGIIFVSQQLVEYPPEHDIQTSISISYDAIHLCNCYIL